MINEIISMNGYGTYVWSAFSFTLISFAVLYAVIKMQLVKEQIKFNAKFVSLTSDKNTKSVRTSSQSNKLPS